MASVAAAGKQFSGKLTGDGRLEIPESGDIDTLTRQNISCRNYYTGI